MERILTLLAEGPESALIGYQQLTTLLKRGGETPETSHRDLSNPSSLSRIIECINRDLQQQLHILSTSTTTTQFQPSPQEQVVGKLQQECLRALGFLIHSSDIAALLTTQQCSGILDSLCRTIKSSSSAKQIVCLAVWCVSVQSFPASKLTIDLAMAVCSTLKQEGFGCANFTSDSLECESLTAIGKLILKIKDQFLRKGDFWFPLVYRRLLSPSKTVREKASQTVCIILQTMSPIPPQLSSLVLSDLSKDLLDLFGNNFVKDCDEYCVRCWGYFVGLLGSNVFHGATVQRLLKFAEQFFTHQNPEFRALSFESWSFLIQQYSREKSLPKSMKNLKLIIAPFDNLFSRTESNFEVLSKGFSSWCSLLSVIGSENILEAFDLVFSSIFTKILNGVASKTESEQNIPISLLIKASKTLIQLFMPSTSLSDQIDFTQQPQAQQSPPPQKEKSAPCLIQKITFTWLKEHLPFFLCSFAQISEISCRKANLSEEEKKQLLESVSLSFKGVSLCLCSILKDSTATKDEHIYCVKSLVSYVVKELSSRPSDFESVLSLVDGATVLLSPRSIVAQCSFEMPNIDDKGTKLAFIGHPADHLFSAWMKCSLSKIPEQVFLTIADGLLVSALQVGDAFICVSNSFDVFNSEVIKVISQKQKSPSLAILFIKLWTSLCGKICAILEQNLITQKGSDVPTLATRCLILLYDILIGFEFDEELPKETYSEWQKVVFHVCNWIALKSVVNQSNQSKSVFLGEISKQIQERITKCSGKPFSTSLFLLSARNIEPFVKEVDWIRSQSDTETINTTKFDENMPPKKKQKTTEDNETQEETKKILIYLSVLLEIAHSEAASATKTTEKSGPSNISCVSSIIKAVSSIFSALSSVQLFCETTKIFRQSLILWIKEPKPVGSRLSVTLDESVVSLKNDAFSLWESFCVALKRIICCVDNSLVNSEFLMDLEPLLCAGLMSKHRKQKAITIEVWNSTFGSSPTRFNYPMSLITALRSLQGKATIELPFIDETKTNMRQMEQTKKLATPMEEEEEEELTAIDERLRPPTPKQIKPIQSPQITLERQIEATNNKSDFGKGYTAFDPLSQQSTQPENNNKQQQQQQQQQIQSPSIPAAQQIVSSSGATPTLIPNQNQNQTIANTFLTTVDSLIRETENNQALDETISKEIIKKCAKLLAKLTENMK